MKTSELSMLYYLDREIEKLQKALQKASMDILDLAESTGNKLSHVPRSKGGSDKEDRLVELIDIKIKAEKIIGENLARAQQERLKIEEFIGKIEDVEIRYIIRLRHLEGMSWKEIANEISNGRYVHEDTPRKKYKAYFDRQE